MKQSAYKLVFLLLSLSFAAAAQHPANNYQKLSLDQGWLFHMGDIAFPVIKGHSESYMNAKAGNAPGPAAPGYDDRSWRKVTLPHDWSVETSFDQNENISQGYRMRGMGWYRRYFKLNTDDRGKHLELQFDGVATHCTVWINGTVVHRNWSGYTSFYIDITALAKYGDEINTVAVQVNAVDQEGWWYEGAGIYRHTWLVKHAPAHIITDGVYAHPVKNAQGSWDIPAEITLENSGKLPLTAGIEISVFDQRGQKITSGNTSAMIAPLDRSVANIALQVSHPGLWSPDNPVLYNVVTLVKLDGITTDSLVTSCGFRTLRFTADSGFYLNEKRLKIKGVCNHQDAAGVGVAVPGSIWEFRLRKLKEMGVNAYRCAHNPPSAEFLDACDRLGIMVMDENRNFNSSPEYISQLRWMVRRDRNHPSIILWSVFNEEPMQGTEIGYEMVRRLSAEVKKLDTSRPVTAAMNGGLFAPVNVSQAVDVVGFNYQQGSYDQFHREHPTLSLTSSEDVSGLMQRGVYITDKARHTLDSYDTQAPGWGATHRVSWKAIAERPYLAGCFVWTGFDYRGEPTPYNWPTAGSNFGIMDACGFPKTAFYIHQAQWVNDKPVLHIEPHWNWPAAMIGKPIHVMAESNAETVKLVLNGKVVSEQKVDRYEMNSWEVPYYPGILEAIGSRGGKEVSHFKVETTGEPVSIRLTTDRADIQGDGWDAIPVTVQAIDRSGRPVPTANLPIEFELTGPGDIIGLGNGDPNSHEPDKGSKRSLYNGLAQVILQSRANADRTLVLTASSPGLRPARVTIGVRPKASVAFVSVTQPDMVLDDWRISPVSKTKPDANQQIAANDMNSWAPVKPGQLQTLTDGSFVIYRTTFTPYTEQQEKGCQLVLKKLTGKAEVYLDSKRLFYKNTGAGADITISVPAIKGERTISVLIESEAGERVGLGGVVSVR
ncbi:beta-galactosidase [Mucilaginibacter gracilis]|uniref:Beta-galactosidase n=1 Tax=Mucilaginibacter gracilis TaxID=423350 RepID=A0A495ITQ4_9SPHI|nr:beta-galactosidase GalA [Mucilaginibacter gracilis]RKR79923.1 beta-galactosidase [Mucilaginibacter gracilis]